MEPALLPGDHIFIKKRPVSIHRGDIVVYEFPEDPSKDFIHRLIGLAGDIVEIRDKKLLINGRSIEEPYIRFSGGKSTDNTVQARDNMPAISVPEGKIFVLGDNRDRSYDSRFWGFVESEKVKGIARAIYFSWDRDNMRVRWSRIGMPPREYGTGTAP
jgi:signal peptidase I